MVDVWVIYWTIRIKNESKGSHFPVVEVPKNQNFSLGASHGDTIGSDNDDFSESYNALFFLPDPSLSNQIRAWYYHLLSY